MNNLFDTLGMTHDLLSQGSKIDMSSINDLLDALRLKYYLLSQGLKTEMRVTNDLPVG